MQPPPEAVNPLEVTCPRPHAAEYGDFMEGEGEGGRGDLFNVTMTFEDWDGMGPTPERDPSAGLKFDAKGADTYKAPEGSSEETMPKVCCGVVTRQGMEPTRSWEREHMVAYCKAGGW